MLSFLFRTLFLKIISGTKKLSSVASLLTKWTGKSKEKTHPKHLIPGEHPWFLRYLKKKDTVLDLGCGQGENTFKAAEVCQKVIGLEIDKSKLKIANKEKKRLKVKNVKFLLKDIEQRLNFKTQTFHVVLILDVLEHLRQRKLILKEIHRILRKGGDLILSVPNKNTSWKKKLKAAGLTYYSDPDHKIEYNWQEIKKELKLSGFTIIKRMPIIYDFPLVGFIDLIGGVSLPLYKELTLWRRKKVLENPQETTGFRIVCKKYD